MQCAALVSEGAVQCATAAECVAKSEITFAMLADPEAALTVVFGPRGALETMGPGKVGQGSMG